MMLPGRSLVEIPHRNIVFPISDELPPPLAHRRHAPAVNRRREAHRSVPLPPLSAYVQTPTEFDLAVGEFHRQQAAYLLCPLTCGPWTPHVSDPSLFPCATPC